MTEKIKKVMRTKLNNKGFSLVELLIVIAIMGVLAVIAFNAFGGVLVGSKKNADKQQAKNIERAIRTFITDSGVVNVTAAGKLYSTSGVGGAAGTPITGITAGTAGAQKLITSMMATIYVKDQLTGEWKSCGPYLNAEKAGNDYKQFSPQWTPDAGGQNIGWNITIDRAANNPVVEAITGTEASAETYNLAITN